MKTHLQKLSGVFLPITTPFNKDMTIDFTALKSNMEFYAKSQVHGYLALGSNGENRCLREVEKRAILDVVMENKAPEQIVMTGCIYDSTVLTFELMRYARNIKSDYVTLLSPSYYRKFMTHDVLVDYFTECAERIDIPVMLYNAPGFTGITLAPETVGELAKHPRIVGMKDSASEGIENFCQYNSPEFVVLAGSIGFIYTSMVKHGVKGGVVSLGNAFPEAGYRLWEYGTKGESEAGNEYQERMKIANKRISGTYGVAGVKAAMDLAGLAGMYPRKPLRRLEESDREKVREVLVEAGLLS